MARRSRAGSRRLPKLAVGRPGQHPATQQGFTLAGLIVVMTIMMVFVAFTVPRMWSTVMKRERERQTIFAMQQYAKAITNFQIKNNSYPTSPQQLKDARLPRMIRGVKGELIDPLTGEVDWLVIPQSAAGALPQRNLPGNPNVPPGGGPAPAPVSPIPTTSSGTDTSATGTTGTSGTNPTGTPALPGIPIKDYAGGPFIGVRPPTHGKSLINLLGADTYETWVYTSLDYTQEKQLRTAAWSTVFH
jgi:type II secretory pathway pseudopilin PulG